MIEDTELTKPAAPMMDLIEEHQEGKFHNPILKVPQDDEAGGTDYTMEEKDPDVGRFDVMLDVSTLNTDGPPTEYVAEEAQTANAAIQSLTPPAMDTDNGGDPKVSDALGIINESS